MLLLERNTTKKRQVDENATELDTNDNNSGKYKVKAICDNAVYAKESIGYLPKLYYLVSWKSYPKKENT